jgi:hypothetical protein
MTMGRSPVISRTVWPHKPSNVRAHPHESEVHRWVIAATSARPLAAAVASRGTLGE